MAHNDKLAARVRLALAGCGTQRAVDAWVKRALTFVATLPPKKK